MRLFPLFIATAILSAGAFALRRGSEGTAGGPNSPRVPPPPVSSEVAGVLYRVGLSAETLAASSVTAPQVPGAISAALAHYDALVLHGLSDAYSRARAEATRLSDLVRSGLGTQEDVAALGQANATLASAEASLKNYLDTMRSAACNALVPGQAAAVQTSFSNRAWDLPVQYLVKDRPQSGWVDLREALATKRISENYGYDFPQSAQNALALVDGEAEIAQAKANLDANIFDVQTAWNLAAGDSSTSGQ